MSLPNFVKCSAYGKLQAGDEEELFGLVISHPEHLGQDGLLAEALVQKRSEQDRVLALVAQIRGLG